MQLFIICAGVGIPLMLFGLFAGYMARKAEVSA